MKVNTIVKKDIWSGIYTIVFVVAFPYIGEMLFPQMNGILRAGISGASGAILGIGIYNLVKNKKTVFKAITLSVGFGVFLGLIVFLSWMNSDQQLIKREWHTVTIESVSFQYPNKFNEMNLDLADEQKETTSRMQAFSDGNNDRHAMYLIYDIMTNAPSMDDSLSGSLANMLENMNATDVNYYDIEFTDYTLETKVSYNIGKNTYIGYAFIYNKNNHYESMFFVPYKKRFSNEYLEKLISSIKISPET